MAKKRDSFRPPSQAKPSSQVTNGGPTKPHEFAEPEYKRQLQNLDATFGVTSINQRLNPEQEREAAEVLIKGADLKSVFARPSEEELDRHIEEVVRRTTEILAEKLTPPQRLQLTAALSDFAVGIMAAAAWDLLKVFIPFLQNAFMAAEPTNYMRKVAAWEQETNAALPENMRGFASTNQESLMALRAQVWGELRDRFENCELGEALGPLLITDISETFESRLFVQVRA